MLKKREAESRIPLKGLHTRLKKKSNIVYERRGRKKGLEREKTGDLDTKAEIWKDRKRERTKWRARKRGGNERGGRKRGKDGKKRCVHAICIQFINLLSRVEII